MSAFKENAEAVARVRRQLQSWVEANDWGGYEPYDLLNSPYLKGNWTKAKLPAAALIQLGRRFAGVRTRRWLQVPSSHNPKALALFLAAYCDLMRLGEACPEKVSQLKDKLQVVRSPSEPLYCWGYDWEFVSLRGSVLRKFSPNSIATCFCAHALLDAGQTLGDRQAEGMAESAAQFLVSRLNRSVDTERHVCFSYTPENRTRILNNSVLVGALLARLGNHDRNFEYLDLARRAMQYLVDCQGVDGSWAYGAGGFQQWIDGFHTGYNLCALLDYRSATNDGSFDRSIDRGYEFYKRSFFRQDGAPKYFHNRLYPIDIHACSQAIMTFCAFRDRDPEALGLARRTADWTIQNMRSPEGAFFYQRHRLWTNRTPYMRWGQAWMFRALARLERSMMSNPEDMPGSATGVLASEKIKVKTR
jgi:hypothetical protein